MSSSSIQSQLFPPTSPLSPISSLGLSEQNEKIFQLVIGKIIPALAFGALITCIVFSFVATPLFGIGAVPAFVIGMLGIAATHKEDELLEIFPIFSESPPPPFVTNQPIGITNGGNNCWANSTLQIVLNNPELEAKFSSDPAFRDIFIKYRAAQSAKTHVCSSLTGREVRDRLIARGVEIGSGASQEDSSVPFEEMLGASNGASFYSLTQTRDGRASSAVLEPMISLELDLDFDDSFSQLFNTHFRYRHDGSDFIRKFQTAPQTLLVHLKRFAIDSASGAAVKINRAYDVPLETTLTADKSVDNREARYHCNGFIQHLGSTLNGGHYVAYIRREGKWWYCSDSYVREAGQEAVEAARKNAYIFSYTRV